MTITHPLRNPPLGDQLLAQLRSLIVRGELSVGTHLVEGRIAERFGVSRGPVRDALRQLEIEGLVETRERGVFVRGLSDHDLVELYSLPGALEGLAIQEAIARLDAADRDLVPVAEDHAYLRDVVRSGDVEAALAALTEHLHGSCSRIRVTLSERARPQPAS
ncbi:GntR family transcriptional regulator [Nonomuraea polychroma]|uniref:GntR family transcriptional regulator n=1 Tax=Nonomuraea polychroma TaxID=46176 RepID=UPI003D9266FD